MTLPSAERWARRLLVVLASAAVLVSCLRSVLISASVHLMLIERHNVSYRLPFDDVDNTARMVAAFLRGSRESKDLEVIFGAREIEHLIDVRALVSIVRTAQRWLILFVVAGTLFWFLRRRGEVGRVLILGGCLTVAVAAVSGGVGYLFFDEVFRRFHDKLFRPGTYEFSLGSDKIVALYPEALFRDAGVIVVGLQFASALAMIGLGTVLDRTRFRKPT